MADSAGDYVSAVNSVIGVCKDAEEGFRGAANAVTNPDLQAMFEQYSRERAGFADELSAVVRRLGSEPAEPSGVLGAIHHGWIALKGVLTGHSEHQILEETERGEDLSLADYRQALAKQLPVELRSVLERQYQEVQQAHRRIKSLRSQTAKGRTAVG